MPYYLSSVLVFGLRFALCLKKEWNVSQRHRIALKTSFFSPLTNSQSQPSANHLCERTKDVSYS
ncbi:MAG: hypothetical protein ACPGIF_00605, partial [Flavobacteriales bacterium]